MSQLPRTQASKASTESHSAKSSSAKALLSTLKMTTAVGAVSLSLAGWGLLARGEALTAVHSLPSASAQFASAAQAAPFTAGAAMSAPTTQAAPSSPAPASAAALPTVTAPAATPAAAPTITLDIRQWVQTASGDQVAVVRDNRGILWYVWGSDVPRIEQGLSPQYQPQPVNQVTRTRRS